MYTRTTSNSAVRRRNDVYGEKACLSFGHHELELLEYSRERAIEEGRSWSGKVKKLIRDDMRKNKELADINEALCGVTL